MQFPARLEGSATGLPITEVTVVEAPPSAAQVQPGTQNAQPFAMPQQRPFKQDIYTLGTDEGQVILQWPEKMSAESYAELEDWLALQMRKIARLNSIKPEEKK